MTENISREEAQLLAIDVCNSITQLSTDFFDAIYNVTFIPEQGLAIAETHLETLAHIQNHLCPVIMQKIAAGDVSKLGDLQKVVKEAAMNLQFVANEYNAFYTLPGAIAYFITTPFVVDGTPLEDLTTKVAGYAVAIGAIALVLIYASK